MNAELTSTSTPAAAAELLDAERLVIAVWKRQAAGGLLTVREAAEQLGITMEEVMIHAEDADLMINTGFACAGGWAEYDEEDYTLEDIMIDMEHLDELLREWEGPSYERT